MYRHFYGMGWTGNGVSTSTVGLHFVKKEENMQIKSYTLALSDAAVHKVGLLTGQI